MNSTAIQVMGISATNFNDMTREYKHTSLSSIKDALTVVANKSSHHATLWSAIGITEKQFSKLDDLYISRLSNHWARLKDPQKFQELEKQENERTRLQKYAAMGLTEQQFMAIPDTERASIIAAFANADAQKVVAREASKSKMLIGGSFAGALALAALFASMASIEFAPAQPDFNIRCSSDDAACMETFREVIKDYAPN